MRLRRLRAFFRKAVDWVMGRASSAEHIPVAMTEAQWREQQRSRYRSAQRSLLLNAVLIGGMIASAIYAPAAGSPEIVWLISSALAELLSRRGVNWQAAWHQASLLMMGR